MNTANILSEFVIERDFSQESIDDLLLSIGCSRKQLISRTFKLLNYFIPRVTDENDLNDYISSTIDFLFVLCENSDFNRKEIDINRLRIKKARESLLALANKYSNYELLNNANKLDEITLAKNIEVQDLVVLIKQLIDRKEDVNVIKKILSTNKGSILSNNNELFDYVFNLAIESIINDDREKFYYITLLKIFYTSKLDKKKYIDVINNYFDTSNPFANEIYMLILGVKRSLSPEQILDKYEVYDNLPYSKVYVPKSSFTDDDILLTIDSSDTFIRDDALSIRKDGNLYIVGTHIVDVPSIIKPGTPLDTYALNNFECKFLMGGKRTRLYHGGVEEQMSLNENTYRPVLSLYVVINEYGEVQDYYFMPNTLKIARNLTYGQCDDFIDHKGLHEEGPMLYDLYKLAKALESKNSDRLKYWNIKNLSKNDMLRSTKSDTVVRENMILYGITMSNEAKEKGIPFNYRIQDQEYISYLIDQSNISINDPTRLLIKEIYLESQYSDTPRMHTGLNTPVYCQATAPLRRYPDSYNQRLYHHFVLGDIHFDFNEEKHKLLIHYFNQRAEELSLMSSEYNREMKLTRKR